ncbi:MAG: hypothetical protein IJU76_00060, partial [Desulfovibrionaceae bacterium]|nr:hypothetical protein [Desulfovibrionaceae bacterium]
QDYKGIGGQAATLVERMIAEFNAVPYFKSLPIEPTNNFAELLLVRIAPVELQGARWNHI